MKIIKVLTNPKKSLFAIFTFISIVILICAFTLMPFSGVLDNQIIASANVNVCDEGYDLSVPALLTLVLMLNPNERFIHPEETMPGAYDFYFKQTIKVEGKLVDQLIVATIDKSPTTERIPVGVSIQASEPHDEMILGVIQQKYASLKTGDGTRVSAGLTAGGDFLGIGVSTSLELAYEHEKSRTTTTAVGAGIQYVFRASEFEQTDYPFNISLFLNIMYYKINYYVFVKGVNDKGDLAWVDSHSFSVAEVYTEYYMLDIV